MTEEIETTKTAEYPQLLSSEMVSLIESLSLIRRLVTTDNEQFEESVFCKRVTDTLLHLSGISASCISLMTDEGSRCIACSGDLTEQGKEPRCLLDPIEVMAKNAGPGDRKAVLLTQGGHCRLIVPLVYVGKRLGSFTLDYPTPGDFQPWHEQLFRLCADIVTQSLVFGREVRGMRRDLVQQDMKLHHFDTTLRHETLRRQSAESALLRNLSEGDDNTYLDQETGLLNRAAFTHQLQAAADRAQELDQESFLLLLDIDHFQIINEVAGHEAGDQLIRMVAHLLSGELLPDDHCSRLGADEFGLLLQGLTASEAMDRIRYLQNRVNGLVFEAMGERFSISASIGVVHLHRLDCPDVKELIRRAYSACTFAQELHHSPHLFSDSDSRMSKRHYQSRKLVQVIHAIEEDTFELYCQPIVEAGISANTVDAEETRFYSGEILVRMHDEKGELISAGEILQLVERYGLSIKLDQRVVAKTLRELEKHPAALRKLDHVAINLSAQSVSSEEFHNFLLEIVRSARIGPEKLCFEITETAAILNIDAASRLITSLKGLGCSFALDDFGSGHASYLYLRDLDVDYLKIDGEFVRAMAIDPVNQTLVKTMVDMGKILGKKIVAEYVENEITLKLLRELRVDLVQGYFLGRPKPLVECPGIRHHRSNK